MLNKFLKSISIMLVLIIVCLSKGIDAQSKSFKIANIEIVHSNENGDLIYILTGNGDILRLNDGENDILPKDLPKIKDMKIEGKDYTLITEDGKIISSLDIKLPKNRRVIDMEGKFFLLDGGEVYTPDNKIMKDFREFNDVEEIKLLSENYIAIYKDDLVSVIGDNSNGISKKKDLKDVNDIIIYDDVCLVIKKDGTVNGWGNGYEAIKNKILSIKNADEFLTVDENIYIMTKDNKAIVIKEEGFKAPKELLNNVSDIVILKFERADDILYRSYFLKPDGTVTHYIQSNKELSQYSKDKIEYFNLVKNVEKIYDTGYLTVIYHKDKTIDMPFDSDHELNKLEGVEEIYLDQETYIVYLENGNVYTNLFNFEYDEENSEIREISEILNNGVEDCVRKKLLDLVNEELSEDEVLIIKENLEQGDTTEEIFENICLELN